MNNEIPNLQILTPQYYKKYVERYQPQENSIIAKVTKQDIKKEIDTCIENGDSANIWWYIENKIDKMVENAFYAGRKTFDHLDINPISTYSYLDHTHYKKEIE